MRKEDCIDLFRRIPEHTHAQVNLILRNGFGLSVGNIVRFEDHYLVFRGREGGTSDEGRAFFVPYEEITYFRIERVVRIGELKEMYGETGYVDAEERLSTPKKPEGIPVTPAGAKAPPAAPAPVEPSDPASIAKQNLLARIRAARANAAGGGVGGSIAGGPVPGGNIAGTTGKLDNK